MRKGKSILFISFFATVVITACNRNTASDEKENTVEAVVPVSGDTTLITAEQPFKNQPNEFCTVIRKLDAGYYAAGKDIEDVSKYPKKYCLLDVCLEKIDATDMTIDLGDEGEPVTTVYKLIKVFDSFEEAKAYVEKYKIVDYKFEEE